MTKLTLLRPGYADRNRPLLMTMGLRRLSMLIEAVAADPASDDAEGPFQEDSFVAVLLGVLALDRRLTDLVAVDRQAPDGPDDGLTELDRLLR